MAKSRNDSSPSLVWNVSSSTGYSTRGGHSCSHANNTPAARSSRIRPRIWQTMAPVYIVSWGTSRRRAGTATCLMIAPERSVSVTLQLQTSGNGLLKYLQVEQGPLFAPRCPSQDVWVLRLQEEVHTQTLDGRRQQFATTAIIAFNTDWW